MSTAQARIDRGTRAAVITGQDQPGIEQGLQRLIIRVKDDPLLTIQRAQPLHQPVIQDYRPRQVRSQRLPAWLDLHQAATITRHQRNQVKDPAGMWFAYNLPTPTHLFQTCPPSHLNNAG